MNTEDITLDVIEDELGAQTPDLMLAIAGAADQRESRPGRATRGAGRSSLFSSLSDPNQKRLRTLMLLEELFTDYCEPELLDHAVLVFGVCQVVESELGQLIGGASAPAREALVASVRDVPGPHSVLSRWAEGRLPMTLGTLQILYMAWRRLLRGDEGGFGLPFSSGFFADLEGKRFEGMVARLRNEFRNPVAHGSRTFGPDEHEACVALCLGTTTLSRWYEFAKSEPTDDGLLHRHLIWRDKA